ncbi:MAG: OadG family protein [Ignavibacteriaceae bacterium]|nr:OadG family protein [Ignavibacteriaceae bacterium]
MQKLYILIFISLLSFAVFPADTTKQVIKSDSVTTPSATLTTTSPVSDTAGTDMNQLGLKLSRIWELDCHGNGNSLMITFIGMGVVFISLFLLYVVFLNISKLLRMMQQRKSVSSEDRLTVPAASDSGLTGEENAAIAMALHLFHSETHDFENTVLTIQRVSKNYSPWSSKIYGLRHYPQSTKKW